MSTNKSKGESLVNRWISIEYGEWYTHSVRSCATVPMLMLMLMLMAEDRQSKARWYKGLVKKYDRSSDRYLVRERGASARFGRERETATETEAERCHCARRLHRSPWSLLHAQIVWETGGQDWVDELKDNEYKMAKPPAQVAPSAPAPSSGAGAGSANRQQKRKRSVKEAKILVYGLPNSGKTSIINKLADQAGLGLSEEPAGPTHMFNVNRMQWNDVRLTVFDFGGKTEWRRSLWKSYFDQADALVRHHMSSCPPLPLVVGSFRMPPGAGVGSRQY